jgi:DNA-binding NtrC family response regulator
MTESRETPRLLIVDDDDDVLSFLVEALQSEGFAARGTTSGRTALAMLEKESFDLVITDLEMPEMRGTELLAAVHERWPEQLVLIITAFGSIELAVQAVRAGACDFVAKPFQIEVLTFAIERALRERQMRREIVRLRAFLPGEDTATTLVARSQAMKDLVDLARRAAASDATILITGESGTGKGALARFIHEQSSRREAPFVQVNCAALPGPLVESELFGVRKGAFTDARADRPGLFVESSAGTLFLDEIGEMPIEIQPKLLQALETGRVRPLGGAELVADVRLIAATNRPLEDALRERRFRPDLYYRLNVIRIEIPPLRERPEDIEGLVDTFLARASARMERPLLGVSAEAMRWLRAHDWPGNVRELANLIERAVALAEHDTVVLEDFLGAAPPNELEDFLGGAVRRQIPLAEVESSYIRRVLDTVGGNKSRAARLLGIDRRTLYRKLEEGTGE